MTSLVEATKLHTNKIRRSVTKEQYAPAHCDKVGLWIQTCLTTWPLLLQPYCN